MVIIAVKDVALLFFIRTNRLAHNSRLGSEVGALEEARKIQ